MTSRTYAQIECSLKASKKMRGLSNHETRWAYLCAHLSDQCTYTGLFRYPLHIWAHDAQLDASKLSKAIEELVRAGLIDYDAEESYVRIVGWFHKRTGPDNPNRVDSVITDLSSFDDIDPVMYCKSASELTTSAVRRSLRWKQDGSGREQLYKSLKRFLPEVYQDHGDTFLNALKAELKAAPETVGTEVRAIFPPLAVLPESHHGKGSGRVTTTLREHETRRDVDETKTKTKRDLNETAHFPLLEKPQALSQAHPAEVLRKRKGPTVSTKQSTLAKEATQA